MSPKLIKVKVTAGAKREGIEKIGEGVFKVRVSAPPEKGKANERVRELLAEHFRIAKSRVVLISGAAFREKVFSVIFNL